MPFLRPLSLFWHTKKRVSLPVFSSSLRFLREHQRRKHLVRAKELPMKRYLIALVVLFVANSAAAQAPNAGFPKYGSFESGSSDSVNRQNLNSNFSIPIINQRARGLNLSFAIAYNSLMWQNNGTAWVPYSDQNGNPTWGWNQVGVAGYVFQTKTVSQNCIFTYSNVSYVEPNGTSHPFSISYTTKVSPCGSGTTGTTTGYATDDSGYYINALTDDGPAVYSPDGTKILVGSFPQIKDTNGNYVSGTPGAEWDWTDSAGRTALKIIGSAPNPVQYEYQDTTGTYQKFTLTFQNFNVKTNFACGTISEYSGTANLPVSLSMPNGQSYSFNYEGTPGHTGYVTGRISQVTLPNGGYIQYQYGTQNDGMECLDGSSDGTIASLTRVVNDGTTSDTWQFTRSQNGSNWIATETKPQMPYDSASNQSVYTFNSSGQETSDQDYQGSSSGGTLLRTVTTTWASNGSPATAMTNESNQKSQVSTTYDNYGNLLEIQVYDWGNDNVGPLLRTTNYTYLSTSAYTNLNILNRVTLKTIADSTGTIHYREATTYDGTALSPCPTGVPQHDDTNYGCSFATRGNPTAVTVYTNAAAPSGPITKNRSYDVFGNLAQADVDCCQTKKSNFSATTEYADPDSVVSGATGGPQVTTSYTYNVYTTQTTTETDANNQKTSYSYDTMRRPLTITRPDNAETTYAYNDSAHTVAITSPVDSSDSYTKTEYQDGLGRVIKGTVTDGSGTLCSATQLQYDPLGRSYKQSNPYTSSPQYWTTTQFDALDRTTVKILEDNSQFTYAYSGPTFTRTDPAGHQREIQYDGIGELKTAFEPDPSNNNSLTLQTSYAHTVLGAVVSVSQSSQTRTYSYDDAGRMASATTPEGGTTSYQYNNFDKMTQRTDNRGVISSYSYDTLNRLKQVSYNVGTTGVPATPTVTDAYGTDPTKYNNGRLLTLSDGTGSTTYSYDLLGRKTQEAHVIGGNNYNVGYQYNEEGDVTSLTYPSGRVVSQSYDSVGRLASIASGSTTYLNETTYNTDFQPAGFNYGNGVTASFTYSPDRKQLTALSWSKSGTTLFGQSYAMNTSGANDNEITAITDSVDSGRNMTYTYDSLNRLTSAVSQGSISYPQWGLSFSYDRYGNRTAQTVTAGSGPSNSVAVNAATNHITTTGYLYDANGNMTHDGVNELTFDAENHAVTSADGSGTASYSYDGSNKRVQKTFGGTTTVYIFSGNKVLDEYTNGTLNEEYIYRGTGLIAEYAGTTLFYHGHDQLSNRITMDANGNLDGQQGHYPFGEDWYITNTATKWHFTTYERDAESSNDYAKHRYNVNRLGRFLTIDPVRAPNANPQLQNRYSYVANEPIGHRDLDGRLGAFGVDCDPTFDFCECDPYFGCDDGGGGGFCGDFPCEGGGGGGAPPPPPPLPECFCQLKYHNVIGGLTHSYWYVQDSTGIPHSWSGEPTPLVNIVRRSVVFYLNEMQDYPGNGPANGTTWYDTGLSSSNCNAADTLVLGAESWPNYGILYNPFGPNSNSAAHYIGNEAGLFISPPPGAIGWYYYGD